MPPAPECLWDSMLILPGSRTPELSLQASPRASQAAPAQRGMQALDNRQTPAHSLRGSLSFFWHSGPPPAAQLSDSASIWTDTTPGTQHRADPSLTAWTEIRPRWLLGATLCPLATAVTSGSPRHRDTHSSAKLQQLHPGFNVFVSVRFRLQ